MDIKSIWGDGIVRDVTPVEKIPDLDVAKRRMEMENIMTEQEAMQQEVMTRLPGPVAFLLNYEFSTLLKIAGIIIAIALLYFIFGFDVVLSSAVIFIVVAIIVYFLQLRNMKQDFIHMFEVKKAGQIIETGDNSPYKNSFIVQNDRVSMWGVPNTLIRKGIFKLPSSRELSPLPSPGNIIYVDMFDEFNRTCVFPRSPDVANISFETNMNPILAKRLDEIADSVNHAEIVEEDLINLYRGGQVSKKQLQRMLKRVHKERREALESAFSQRRDVVWELQRLIPEYQNKIRYLQDNIHLLADEMATAGIYQLLKVPMPDKVREDHNLIRAIYGLPRIREYKPRSNLRISKGE